MIQTENLTKIYNKGKRHQVQAVIDANITAKEGEITVLVGPSGCGKTTLMSMIGQLLSRGLGDVYKRQTSDIIQIRLIEGTILGFLAGSIGLLLGIFYNAVLNAPILREFMLGWATLYPGFPVPFSISTQTILLTYAITVVPILFATVIPSWLNATVDPDIAMRGARA